MSTTVEAVLVTALVFGIVVAQFAAIYAWEKWGEGTRLAQGHQDAVLHPPAADGAGGHRGRGLRQLHVVVPGRHVAGQGKFVTPRKTPNPIPSGGADDEFRRRSRSTPKTAPATGRREPQEPMRCTPPSS
jgi:hypothetical protein